MTVPHEEHAASRRTTAKPAKRAGTHTVGYTAHPSPLIAEAERIVWEILGTPRTLHPHRPLLFFLLGVGTALAVCLPFLVCKL